MPITRLWLDAEDKAGEGRNTDDNVSDIRAAIEYTRQRSQIPLGIYTGCWWWKPNTGDYAGSDICSLPLWLANYNSPDFNPIPHVTGGWTQDLLYMWQYAGSVVVADLNVDRNLILEPNMDMYTRDELDQKLNAMFGLSLRNQTRIQDIGNVLLQHIINHNNSAVSMSTDDIKKLISDMQVEIDELHTRLANTSRIIGGG